MVSYPPKTPAGGSPMNGPEASALLGNPAALKSLLQSPETRRLMELLQKQGNLQSAAEKAKTGDTRDLQAMLSRLQSSPEGGDALARMEQKLQK